MCSTKYITTSFFLVQCCCCYVETVVAYRLNLRNRRDADEIPGIGIPSEDDPQPYKALGSDNLAPWFPMTHTFADGMSINKGDNTELHGHMNVPFTSWGRMWDAKSHFKSGPDNLWWNYGHLLSPANPLKLSPSTVAGMATSPKLAAERNKAESVPVMNLPTGYTPLKCKPPLCNPFVHTFDTGFHIESAGFDVVPLAASLDFPVRMPDGSFRRFPISGDLDSGQESPSFVYGHVLSPVEPFMGEDRKGRDRMNLPFGFQPEPSANTLSDSVPSRRLNHGRQQTRTATGNSQEERHASGSAFPSPVQALADTPLVSGMKQSNNRATADSKRPIPITSTMMPKFGWPRSV